MKPIKLTPIVINKNPNADNNNAPVSTLRRVVDMSAINAQKQKPAPKKAAHPDDKNENRSKQAQPGDHSHHRDNNRDNNRQNYHQDHPKDNRRRVAPAPGAENHNPAAQGNKLLPQKSSHYVASTPRLVAPPAPEPAPTPAPIEPQESIHTAASKTAPTAQISPAEHLQPEAAPDKPATPEFKKKIHAPARPSARMSSSMHPRVNLKRGNAATRLAEKHPIAHKEIAKSRLKPQKVKPEPDFHRFNEKIDAAFLHQTWYAKHWMAKIAELYNKSEDVFLKCMPLVQARLVNNICVSSGSLEATVFDQVTSISLRTFTQGSWKGVISHLSDKAIFATSILNGELPEGILDIFKQASLSLFPSNTKDFQFSCDCGAEMPCEHICALLITFATMLESDPFQILTLRGMSRDDLLAHVRDARSGQVIDEKAKRRNYEIPAQNIQFSEFYLPKGDFSALNFDITYNKNPLLKRLGNLESWSVPASMHAVFGPIIEIAAHTAESVGQSDLSALPIPEEEKIASDSDQINRAPRPNTKTPHFVMPDLRFIRHELSSEIMETLTEDPIATAEAILTWLKAKGASDIRTLARRTRLHKPTIEAFLNALCAEGLCSSEGENEKLQFRAIF